MSLRDEILATPKAAAGPVKLVPCPEYPAFDGKLFVRRVSPLELDEYFSDDEADENGRAKLTCLFLADATGNRVLRDGDADTLGELDLLPLVERINYAGRVHNGLTDESRQALEKNSEATAGAGSPSS